MDDPFEWQEYKDKVDELTRKLEELKGQVDEDSGEAAEDSGPLFTGRSRDIHRREVVMHYVEGLNDIAKELNGGEEVSIGDYEELRDAFESWVILCEAPGKMEVQQGDMMVGTIGENEDKVYCFVTVADEGSSSGFQSMGPTPYAGSTPWSYHIWSSASSEAANCECESGVSAIGSGSWEVEIEEGCGKFTVLTSIEETSDSEGTTLEVKKRDVHVDKCGKILELSSETSESIEIPCCEEEEEDPCPELNDTYNLTFEIWSKVPPMGPAQAGGCTNVFSGVEYRKHREGSVVFTRNPGLTSYTVTSGTTKNYDLDCTFSITSTPQPWTLNWLFSETDGWRLNQYEVGNIYIRPSCSPVHSTLETPAGNYLAVTEIT